MICYLCHPFVCLLATLQQTYQAEFPKTSQKEEPKYFYGN